MSANGTLADEACALRVCLALLGVNSNQVVQAETSLGLFESSSREKLEQTADYLRSNLKGVQEETLSDFFSKNTEQHPVAPPLTLDGQLVPVAKEALAQIFRDDRGWERFRELYPASSGTVDFSRVGFNRPLTQALVYAGMQVDWTMGYGMYCLLERSGDKWVKSEITMAWIS